MNSQLGCAKATYVVISLLTIGNNKCNVLVQQQSGWSWFRQHHVFYVGTLRKKTWHKFEFITNFLQHVSLHKKLMSKIRVTHILSISSGSFCILPVLVMDQYWTGYTWPKFDTETLSFPKFPKTVGLLYAHESS